MSLEWLVCFDTRRLARGTEFLCWTFTNSHFQNYINDYNMESTYDCVAPINEFQSFLSNPFLFLIFLVFLLKSFFPANSFLFAHLVSHVDSLSLISFFPQHGREIIYWSKGKLQMVIAIKKWHPFPQTIHC